MKVKDILQVSAYYPPHLGGQENAVYDLSQQLAKAGHRVQVLTSSEGSDTTGVTMENKVLVRRMHGLVFGHAPIMPSFPLQLFRAAKSDTIVHLHIGQAFTPEMVWLVSKLRRFKYIAELHIDFEPSGPAGVMLPLYKQLILKRVLQSAASVVVLNEKTLRIVRESYGYSGDVRILHNGINDAYFAVNRPAVNPNPPQILRLLFVGRLSKQKNLPVLLDTLAATKRNMHLDILGDGEESESIKRTIQNRGLTNITLHGRQDRQEVINFYESCDALIMPSLYEAQPLVLLEAMAAGVPIIGTNVIGVADHIRGIGIITEPTLLGLLDGIERYYKQYRSLPRMVKQGRKAANAFRWSTALKEYESLYAAVLGS